MQRTALLVCSFWVVIGAVAAGCASVQAAPEPQTSLGEISQAAEATTTPIPVIDELISLLPETTSVLEPNACLECHSNAEQLRLLAEEEDVPEVPSEGSG